MATVSKEAQHKRDLIKTKSGFVAVLYNSQRGSSKKRGHRMPEYSKETLFDWLNSQTIFHELFDEWLQSGCKPRLKPSVDRKENNTHYCISNIQLMTWEKNRQLFHAEVKSGKSKRTIPSLAVSQYSKDGTFIKSFKSIREACRNTGISYSGISRCVKKERKSAGGYNWLPKGN